MQGLAYVTDLDIKDDETYKERVIHIPKVKSKLLVFDMDETLIHCLGSRRENEERVND